MYLINIHHIFTTKAFWNLKECMRLSSFYAKVKKGQRKINLSELIMGMERDISCQMIFKSLAKLGYPVIYLAHEFPSNDLGGTADSNSTHP